ncbi:MAG: S41 family peptidase [Candidatus Absconditabacterales bacterium]
MKKIIILICFSIFGFGFFASAQQYLNFGQFLDSYFNVILKNQIIPNSYKYIQLKYTNIPQSGTLYKSLQKAVYLDLFPNGIITLPLEKNITQDQVVNIIKLGLNMDFPYQKGALVDDQRLNNILTQIKSYDNNSSSNIEIQINSDNEISIVSDIYQRLKSDYIDVDKLNKNDLIYGAANGMVKATKDEYSTFFPPTDAKQFNEEIQGEYEGIGAYLDMKIPGEAIIVSPIDGSPAKKAGLLAGDKIIKVDNHLITGNDTIEKITSWIKGKSGTSVSITIKRGTKELNFTVLREKIIIKNIETQIFSGKICYMAINMFGFGVADEFQNAMDNFFSPTKCKEYIFDVRNNPGGSLEEVANMLNYFVPTGNPSVIVKSKSQNENILAKNIKGKKITDKNIIIMINKGSASASEIFAGTIKDYGKNVVLMGDKSFGKGSVQSLIEYNDGSMLKYTIARRYTGKSQKSIDKIGISPDIQISDNEKTTDDEQLNFAVKYEFK